MYNGDMNSYLFENLQKMHEAEEKVSKQKYNKLLNLSTKVGDLINKCMKMDFHGTVRWLKGTVDNDDWLFSEAVDYENKSFIGDPNEVVEFVKEFDDDETYNHYYQIYEKAYNDMQVLKSKYDEKNRED